LRKTDRYWEIKTDRFRRGVEGARGLGAYGNKGALGYGVGWRKGIIT